MNIIKYPDAQSADKALESGEPMMAVISFDGKTAVLSQIDEAVEHHILLMKAGFALSHSSKCDIIIEYFISRGNYNRF